ncbi:MAG: 7,8-didemethyl-8-hydroxy-5-deazariboflavin synthase subunit CofH [Cyanobacteria bacterium J06598_1]
MIERILERALLGEDISVPDGIALLQASTPAEWEAIRVAADTLRARQVGDTVTYVLNRNINYTNICEQHCSFCAFRRDADQDGAYWVDWSGILEKACEAHRLGATEICMQGGLNPDAKVEGSSLAYYCKLVETIKTASPELHVHAFSPQEVQFIAREDGLSLKAVVRALRAAGVGSLPGTAAEVLDDNVRRILCPEKTTATEWLEIVGLAHEVGLPTTSTMLSGHIETIEQQVMHLYLLRQLQQRSRAAGYTGITEFILLPFVGQEAPKPLRRRVGRDQPVLSDALLLTAVARIFLGNWIVNHQPSWVKLGLAGATEALRWGCNDIGGILMEEHITSMAGAVGGTCQSEADLVAAIKSVGRPAQQRDTLYGSIEQTETNDSLKDSSQAVLSQSVPS